MPKVFFIFLFDKINVVNVVFVVQVVVLFSDLWAAFFIFLFGKINVITVNAVSSLSPFL